MIDLTDLDNIGAVWSYDQYPFIIASKVTQIRNDGMVYAPAFTGWFDPIRILPLDIINRIQSGTNDLRARKRVDQYNLDVVYVELLNEMTDEECGISLVDVDKLYPYSKKSID